MNRKDLPPKQIKGGKEGLGLSFALTESHSVASQEAFLEKEGNRRV